MSLLKCPYIFGKWKLIRLQPKATNDEWCAELPVSILHKFDNHLCFFHKHAVNTVLYLHECQFGFLGGSTQFWASPMANDLNLLQTSWNNLFLQDRYTSFKHQQEVCLDVKIGQFILFWGDFFPTFLLFYWYLSKHTQIVFGKYNSEIQIQIHTFMCISM